MNSKEDSLPQSSISKVPKLKYGVNDVPSWIETLLYALQQVMVAVTGVIIVPQIVSNAMCAGSDTVTLQTQLISATLVSSGVGTILQSTFGLRLPMMLGPGAEFIPPLLAYKRRVNCTMGPNDYVEKEEYLQRLREVSGSLLLSCLAFAVIGLTGFAAVLIRRIGPVTIVPVMLLLVFQILPMMQEMMAMHWISVVTLCLVGIMIIYLHDVPIPLPKGRKLFVFAQYPLILTMGIAWFICFIMTIFDWTPVESAIRTDRNATRAAFHSAAWIKMPYPGQFGGYRISSGLTLAFLSSILVDIIKNLGSFDLVASVTNQKRAPKDAVNRALIMEGAGSMLAASMGTGSGLTIYFSNVALIQVTSVASRRTMQAAGIMLIVFGIFPKAAAILATIPEPVVAAVIFMTLGMVAGVCLSKLQQIDLNLPRNLTIIGTSLILGMTIPIHITKNPVNTGNGELDEILNMLLSIQMFVGGIIAIFLENTVGGASMTQRGIKISVEKDDTDFDEDGYAFPKYITKLFSRIPGIGFLPFIPQEVPTPEGHSTPINRPV